MSGFNNGLHEISSALVYPPVERSIAVNSIPARNVKQVRPPAIAFLTSVRFLLAVYVVLYHFSLQFSASTPWEGFMSAGYTAVSMFFALSGYVLAYNYFDGREIDLRSFWAARLGRIFPAFAVAEVICVCYLIFAFHHFPAPGVILKELGIGFLFLGAWFRPLVHGGTLNDPAWSLSCEIFFYLLFPLFAVPVSRFNKTNLKIFGAALIVLSVMGSWVYFATNPDGLPFSSLTERAQISYTSVRSAGVARFALMHKTLGRVMDFPTFHLPVFLLGVALGRYRRAFLPEEGSRSLSRRVAFAFCLAALLSVLWWSSNLPVLLLHESIVGILFSFCLLFAESAPLALLRISKWKALLLLGEASYAMYILQLPLFLGWDTISRRYLHQQVTTAFSTYTFVALLIPVSILVFQWIEVPARSYIRRLISVKKKEVVLSAHLSTVLSSQL